MSALHGVAVGLSNLEDWLRAHEDLTRAVFVALFAWALTSWVQARSKRREFRAQTIKDASSSYHRLLLAAVKITTALKVVAEKADPAEIAKITEGDVTLYKGAFEPGSYWNEYFVAVQECYALEAVIGLHFRRRAVLSHFHAALKRFDEATKEEGSDETRSVSVQKARAEMKGFLFEAGIEVGVNTWWRRLDMWTRARWRRFRKLPPES